MQNYDPMTSWERDLFEATYQLDDAEAITAASVVVTMHDGTAAPDGMLDGGVIIVSSTDMATLHQWIQPQENGEFVVRWRIQTSTGRKLEGDFGLAIVVNL